MSWSSDIRCLFCDGRLPLYRKITSGQFCSAAHRKLYWQEQERLGVERLHQTHDSLYAVRPPEGVQAILGPPPSGIIVPEVAPKFDESSAMVSAEPYSYESDLAPQTPLWAPQIAADSGVEAPGPVAGFVGFLARPQPKWPMDRLEMAEPNPLSPSGKIRIPLRASSSFLADIRTAGVTKIPIQPRDSKGASRVEALPVTLLPCRDLTRTVAPEGFPQAAPETEEDHVPFPRKLMTLTAFAANMDGAKKGRRDPWPAAPFPNAQRVLLPLAVMECGLGAAAPVLAGLRRLSIDQVPLVHGTWIDNLRAMGSEGESPRYELSTPALRPRLKLAAGSRYSVATRDAITALAVIEPESVPAASAVSIPARKAMAAVASAGQTSVVDQIPAPGAAGLLPLASAKANEPEPAHTVQSINLPQPLCSAPVRPRSHLEPLDAKPVMDIMSPVPAPEKAPEAPSATKKDEPAKSGGIEALIPPEAKDSSGATAWMHVTGFWKHAPRDLKLLVFGIPILLGLALQPRLKKIPFTAPPQAAGIKRGIERNFKTKLNEEFKAVKQSMVDRAAIALDEDFRAGLDDWTSRGGTTDWAFDATGFVRPGPLALYVPSIDLTDYQLQFLGLIDKKALSWVVRAADFDDYYVVKLVVLKPGPVPTIGVTRYAVIHGKAQDRVDTMAFINAREDMLYRVRMDIHGDTFALTVQGQLVDSWSESRLRKGGVGFFTARGEASRLRWVQVTHQYDMLGRLCAYLAPYNIPSTNGGWQP
jgi:hypothetical protein